MNNTINNANYISCKWDGFTLGETKAAILVINCFWDFACLMLDLNFEFMFFVVYLKRKMLNCINVKH